MNTLDTYARELDKLSGELGATERALVPAEKAYEAWLDTYETGIWEAHVHDEKKLPSAEMRLRLARRDMPAELLGVYTNLISKRKRIEKRLAALKASVSAQQSILSALKAEAEASR